MTGYTVAETAEIVGGTLEKGSVRADYLISRILTDSRSLFNPEGVVFFALKGPRNNGHSFIPELAEKGVKVFIVSETDEKVVKDSIVLIRVVDTLTALHRLAACHRRRFSIPVIGITGSNGKTVIKEWLYDLLSDRFSIVRSPKSYNSQIGVPLSVWLLQPGNNLGIFEAGISFPGEMDKLGEIIRPEIGIFTNIGDAHQENFTTLEQKVQEKLQLFTHSKLLVFCEDHQYVASRAWSFCREHQVKPFGWSLTGKPSDPAFTTDFSGAGTRITMQYSGKSLTFEIPMNDPSSVENACHCMAVILAMDLDPELFLTGFTRLEPLSMRLELKRGVNETVLLNDYYNSDINSLEIALNVLNYHSRNEQITKCVILSDIRQSGFQREELYSRVNILLTNAGIDSVIGIGPEISLSSRIFTLKKEFYPSTTAFLATLKSRTFSREAILIKGAREFCFEEISAVLQQKQHQTMLEINLNALVDNLNCFRSLLIPGTKIMVMVKAFSYGTGDTEIARMLQLQHVDYLAVAVTDEGKELRNAGITVPVIVMNPEPHSFQQMVDYQLEPNLYSFSLAGEFARTVDLNGISEYPVHLKIDTGMNRLGIKTEEEIREMIVFLIRHPFLKVQSVFSHLAASDDPLMDGFTREQFRRFSRVSDQITGSLGYPVMRHILNSAGIERFPEFRYEMVRLGIGLYGISCTGLPLRQIGRLRSVISQIKEVGPAETVGYNRSGTVSRVSLIAVIPVGYADGVDRRWGNLKGKVMVNRKPAPVTGNICMDMLMADVTDIDCQTGDEVEIFGEGVTVQEMAGTIGTIPYEILTGISQRVKRVYLQE